MDSLRSNGNQNRIPFYKKVLEVTKAYWEKTAEVNDDRAQVASTVQGFKARYPKELGFADIDLSNYDLVVRVFLQENSGNVLASAAPFWRNYISQRPISGTVHITMHGDEFWKKAKDSVNRAAAALIHEFGHLMGYISFSKYHSEKLKYKEDIGRF